ncbi:unnamed protein product [Blepharisma stoltei]|uniref:Uncharacterized protein n=1 Tax=Blepharisma stoltei TaxID=1481888 RepID=A0AAU9JUH0_9CILI|nr:unnamed protein product [Blepharisma stoltei]
MNKIPVSLKISYQDDLYKLSPVPSKYEDLIEAIFTLIPTFESYPSFYYIDRSGDKLKISTQMALDLFYEEYPSDSKLYVTSVQQPFTLPQKRPKQDTEAPPPEKKILKQEAEINSEEKKPTKQSKIKDKITDLFDDDSPLGCNPKSESQLQDLISYKNVLLEVQNESTGDKFPPSKCEGTINGIILDPIKDIPRCPSDLYQGPSRFMRVISELIFQTCKKHGPRSTAAVFRIPLELVCYIFKEPAMPHTGKLKHFDNCYYLEQCKPQNGYIFTPLICYNIVRNLKEAKISKEQVQQDFAVGPDVVQLWINLFSEPKEAPYQLDPYPDSVKPYIISDYLAKKLDEDDLELLFNIKKDTIINWIYSRLMIDEEPVELRIIHADEKYQAVKDYKDKTLKTSEIEEKYMISDKSLRKWIVKVDKGEPLKDSKSGEKTTYAIKQAWEQLSGIENLDSWDCAPRHPTAIRIR